MEQENNLISIYEKIKGILYSNDIQVSDYRLIEYGLQFTVSVPDWSGIIRVYKTKNGGAKVDCSQLKGEANANKIQNLIGSKGAILKSKNLSEKLKHELPMIGTDESGKGDYFGPLVAAGVYVDEQTENSFITLGVKDSKKLSDRKILELAPEIFKICKGRFAIIEISPKKYNDLYEQFRKEKKKLNTLLAWGHAMALEEILFKVDCKIAIADQFADESFIINKLKEKGRKLKLIQMPKAEQNTAVAAASIIARARFLVKMSELSGEYKIDLPKGASPQVIEAAKKFVNMYGKDALKKVAKMHFKTTKEVLAG